MVLKKLTGLFPNGTGQTPPQAGYRIRIDTLEGLRHNDPNAFRQGLANLEKELGIKGDIISAKELGRLEQVMGAATLEAFHRLRQEEVRTPPDRVDRQLVQLARQIHERQTSTEPSKPPNK